MSNNARFEDYVDFEVIEGQDNVDAIVSIYCLTYNHVDYIEDAINGFINQNTNFAYEIFIFDDASTDGTSEIVRAYAMKYPELIRAYIAKNNTYGTWQREDLYRDFLRRKLKGKFIAQCEGDDYWTSTSKLQKQFNILNSNDSLAMCIHNATWVDCTTNESRLASRKKVEGILGPEDFICKYEVDFPSAAVMVTREFFFVPSELKNDFNFGDYQVVLNVGLFKKIYYLPEVMSVYRYRTIGSWSEQVNNNNYTIVKHGLDMIRMLEKYEYYSRHKYTDYVRAMQGRYLQSISCLIGKNVLNSSKYEWSIEENEIILKAKSLYDERDDFSKLVKIFIDKLDSYDEIYVMGAGNYAKKMYKALLEWNINVSAFIVSSNNNISELCGKRVLQADDKEIKDKGKIITIIAININEVPLFLLEETLVKNGFLNYICPFSYMGDLCIE